MTLTLSPLDTAELNNTFVGHMRPGAIIKLAKAGEARPAAGWYSSQTGDITLDGDVEFDQRRTLHGLITHEASHSQWSNWLTIPLLQSGKITDAELGVIKTLEEARIEARAVQAFTAGARINLRSCYSHLLADGFADPDNYVSVAGSITCWALAWGRTHSGVVDHAELELIDTMLRDRFGDFAMDTFDDLLGEFTTLNFGYWNETPKVHARAITIAQEWLEMVKSLQAEEGEMDTETIIITIVREMLGDEDGDVPSGSGDKAEGDDDDDDDDDGEGEGSGDGDDDKDGESVKIRKVSHGDGGEGEREGWAEEFVAVVEEVSADPTRVADVRRMSNRDRKARIWKNKKARSGTNWQELEPTARHRHLITRFAKALERDASPAVVRTRVSSQVPPGRLNGRGAMAAAADRAGGRMTTAQPWRANRRHHVERPPVIIGLATDTSGSMSSYTYMLGDVAYVTAHASKRVNARFAAVTFGAKAEPVVAVGETPSKVRVRSANSPHEAYDDAMASLDGPLRLTDNSVIGRKLLIVVSDGELVRMGERDKAMLWLRALNDGGTDVIWVGTQTNSYLKRMAEAEGIKVKWVNALADAEAFVDAIMSNLKGSS